MTIALPKNITKVDLIAKFKHDKEIAVKYQKRRHKAWAEIYELYRNTPTINRLTQRQAINIPLMKETINARLSEIGQEPFITFDSLSGELDKEIVITALWEQAKEDATFDLIDRVDKKQESLYGRSHTELVIQDGEVIPQLVDIYDLLIDPNVNPLDIETADYIIKTNIIKTVEQVKNEKTYDEKARKNIKETDEPTTEIKKAREQRLRTIGLNGEDDIKPYEKTVFIEVFICNLFDNELKEYVRYYCVIANESKVLRAETLKKVTGEDFYPFESWASDVESRDWYSDGMGDLILVPNKTINIWISQHMENRTLRSFGMNFYDSTIDDFEPMTFMPRPNGWYPVPGNPKEVFQRYDVPELAGSLNDIQFIINTAEKASATGSINKGAVEDVKRTLGEIEIAVANSARITASSELYYNTARRRLVEKWYKLVVANGVERTLYKKNDEGKMVPMKVTKEMYEDKAGYKVTVGTRKTVTGDRESEIKNFMLFKQQFLPDNPALNKIIQSKFGQILELTSQQMDAIQKAEDERLQQQINAPQPTQLPELPATPQVT